MDVRNIEKPYLLFLGDVPQAVDAKTAYGLAHWRPEWCIGQIRLPGCAGDTGLPDLTLQDAAARGARTLVIGVTPTGGALTPEWIDVILDALGAGLDVASGLHTRLSSVSTIANMAARLGRRLFDIRHSDVRFKCGGPRRRSGRRLLTVGTDSCVGKKYTALSIDRELRKRGRWSDFRATGQTGILISERGVAIDAVVADFISGAAEWLSPDNHPEHWDVIEGQGSLYHPSFAGVTMGLLHGSQPDAIVLCHVAGHHHILDFPEIELPSLKECAQFYLQCARLTNLNAALLGVSLNTSALSAELAMAELESVEEILGVPCCDPLRTGVGKLVDALDRHFGRDLAKVK